MIDIRGFRDWVDEDLSQFGFRRRGMVWRLVNSEVQWGVQLHKNIYSQYYMLDVGLDLQTETLRKPRDCPISGLLDLLPMVKDTWVVGASMSKTNMDDEERKCRLSEALQIFGRFAVSLQTTEHVARALQAGEFRSFFIHKDVWGILGVPSS